MLPYTGQSTFTLLFQKLLSQRTIKAFTQPDRIHICKICKSTFKTKSNLKDHMNTVHDDSRYVCDMCGKCYNCKKRLRAHIAAHRAPATLQCQVWGTSYYTTILLLITPKIIHYICGHDIMHHYYIFLLVFIYIKYKSSVKIKFILLLIFVNTWFF